MKYPKTDRPDAIQREAFTRDDIKALIEKLPPEWSTMVLVDDYYAAQEAAEESADKQIEALERMQVKTQE